MDFSSTHGEVPGFVPRELAAERLALEKQPLVRAVLCKGSAADKYRMSVLRHSKARHDDPTAVADFRSQALEFLVLIRHEKQYLA